jgi:hypothetical protein
LPKEAKYSSSLWQMSILLETASRYKIFKKRKNEKKTIAFLRQNEPLIYKKDPLGQCNMVEKWSNLSHAAVGIVEHLIFI